MTNSSSRVLCIISEYDFRLSQTFVKVCVRMKSVKCANVSDDDTVFDVFYRLMHEHDDWNCEA